eukprot:scaffold133216_cov57-Phaeocystis_antarctica.AAC.5
MDGLLEPLEQDYLDDDRHHHQDGQPKAEELPVPVVAVRRRRFCSRVTRQEEDRVEAAALRCCEPPPALNESRFREPPAALPSWVPCKVLASDFLKKLRVGRELLQEVAGSVRERPSLRQRRRPEGRCEEEHLHCGGDGSRSRTGYTATSV